MAEAAVTPEMMQGALLHFESGVPIVDLAIRSDQKQRMARVEHVYWQFVKNPFLDPYQLFRQLVKGHYADPPSECRAAEKDKALFDFVVKTVTQQDRKVSEAQVRAVSKRLMQNGMATDNGRDMAEGAKILMKLDRLDQPENEQVNMSKAVFLPPVVTISAHEVDDTKEDLNDKQALAIMDKYNAYVDEKRKTVDDKVAVMIAARENNLNDNPNDNDYLEPEI